MSPRGWFQLRFFGAPAVFLPAIAYVSILWADFAGQAVAIAVTFPLGMFGGWACCEVMLWGWPPKR